MKSIAIANNKGGVGKSTLAINLAAGLAEHGKGSIILDLDPQASVTEYFNIKTDRTVDKVIMGEIKLQDAVHRVTDRISVIPSQLELVDLSFDGELEELPDRLRDIEKIKGFDFLLIDTAPSLGDLLVNALIVADYVLVPLLCEHMAVTGWKILERVIRYAKGQNKRLRTLGIVPTMYDSRTVNSREMLKFMREQLSGRVNIFNTIIPRNVSVSEAPILEIDVLTYEPKSTGAQAFRKLTHEVLSAINSDRR